ncbi:MAG: hypothetical protein Edafosvirus25_7 [Edafosvirus sp.]|uniref:Uncharacterized protein n=1 Tax=Edafosvirus sp. TaxID=2487765 RepID=A0A3G4ZYN4_9VIRU|nr:MAG: hypothetical protein Edafosvirus25_7 [Edafosvirus sp.]
MTQLKVINNTPNQDIIFIEIFGLNERGEDVGKIRTDPVNPYTLQPSQEILFSCGTIPTLTFSVRLQYRHGNIKRLYEITLPRGQGNEIYTIDNNIDGFINVTSSSALSSVDIVADFITINVVNNTNDSVTFNYFCRNPDRGPTKSDTVDPLSNKDIKIILDPLNCSHDIHLIFSSNPTVTTELRSTTIYAYQLIINSNADILLIPAENGALPIITIPTTIHEKIKKKKKCCD